MAGRLRTGHHNVGLVVRQDDRGGIPARQVADAVGLPLTAQLHTDKGLAARVDRGESLPVRRSSLAAAAADLVEMWFPDPDTWSSPVGVASPGGARRGRRD